MAQEWVIPSDLIAARDVVGELLDEAEAAGYTEGVCFAIRLALEEALSNAIKHGNCCDPAKKVKVCAEVDKRRASVSIADEGEGFNPADVPDPTADENIEKPSGRGIMLMRAYMDEVVYNRRGNEVRITKRRG